MKSPDLSYLWPGVPLALSSAILFGATAPVSKLLLGSMDAQLLAGLLYLGAGLGLTVVHLVRHVFHVPAPELSLRRKDIPWLAAIIVFGGVLGPLLLMLGLDLTNAATGSLLLNLETLSTLIIAWAIFRENVDGRLVLGAFAILLGAIVLSWDGRSLSYDVGAALIAAACIAWGVDNNLTRKLSSADPVQIAMAKGLVAGVTNVGIALIRGAIFPDTSVASTVCVVGFLGVGVSLVLFVLALRHLGAARTGAYFALAPFIGSLVAIMLLHEPLTLQIALAGLLMAAGLWLHLAERHEHLHVHEDIEHEHAHRHDQHHIHAHEELVSEPHSHRHTHNKMEHAHTHYPDLHHHHSHKNN